MLLVDGTSFEHGTGLTIFHFAQEVPDAFLDWFFGVIYFAQEGSIIFVLHADHLAIEILPRYNLNNIRHEQVIIFHASFRTAFLYKIEIVVVDFVSDRS